MATDPRITQALLADKKRWPDLDPQVTYRANMLPYAEYSDGSAGFSYPQIVPDTGHALMKMGRAFQNVFGAHNEDVMPTNQDAALIAGLAMTGGLAGVGSKAVSGKALAASGGDRLSLPSHITEAGSEPVTARVYRGMPDHQSWPPKPADSNYNAFWASDNPEVAEYYARTGQAGELDPAIGEVKPSILPADVTFQNPMVIDAAGKQWHELPGEFHTPYYAEKAARARGHDGLVIRNVEDDGPLATTYAALRPGTVRSALTGETLFSNPKEAAPVVAVPFTAFKNGHQGFTDEPLVNPFPGHARIVPDPQDPQGAHVWPFDLTERDLQRSQDVRARPDLWANREGAPVSAANDVWWNSLPPAGEDLPLNWRRLSPASNRNP